MHLSPLPQGCIEGLAAVHQGVFDMSAFSRLMYCLLIPSEIEMVYDPATGHTIFTLQAEPALYIQTGLCGTRGDINLGG